MFNIKKKKKVCLIIDNPLRDLDSMILLAYHLANKDVDVYLTSMQDQEYEIASICPDYVLVNYVRPNNKSFLERIYRSGIKIGVLDTEGGAVIMDLEESLIYMIKNGAYTCVTDYFVWGKVQYNAIVNSKLIPSENIYITGTPRYDFCCEPWIKVYEHPNKNQNYILVNTNFPLIFPKFQTFEKEIETFNTLTNFSMSEIIKITNEFHSNWANLIESIIVISKKFDIDIIIRPHPFENELVYEKIFFNYKNVKIIKEGSVIPWLYYSNLLIHRDCSTAIEASFMNVLAVSIEYPILFENHRQEIPRQVSEKVTDVNELINITQKIIIKEKNFKNTELNKHIASNWYRAIDGNSSELISNIILQKLQKNKTNYFIIFNIIYKSYRSKIKFLLRKFHIINQEINSKKINITNAVNIINNLNKLKNKNISYSISFLNKSIRIFEKS